jgi:hypothetical protein
MDDIRLINTRLSEIHKEARDLAALKEKLLKETANKSLKLTLELYSHTVFDGEVKAINVDELLLLKNVTLSTGIFNVPILIYENISGEKEGLALAKSEEEAKSITILNEIYQANKYLEKNSKSANETFTLFKKVLDGHKLQNLTAKT